MHKKQNASAWIEDSSYIACNHVGSGSIIKRAISRDKISNKNIKEIIGNLIKDIIKEWKKNTGNNVTAEQNAAQTSSINLNHCRINPKNRRENNKRVRSRSRADPEYHDHEG